MELKKVPYARLLKLELPELADNVIRVVDKHNPEELQIESIIDLLRAEEPQINLLTSRYGVNPMTAKISLAIDKLLLSVSAINLQLRIVLKESNLETLQHYPVVKHAMDRHLQKLRDSKNYTVINRKVEQFLYEIKLDSELSAAIDALDLTDYTIKLRNALTYVLYLQDSKEEIISQRPQESSRVIAAPVVFALKNVFKQVELAMVKNTELDYTDLFNELNQVINEYRGKISRRDATNKRIAEQKKAQESGGAIENLRIDVDEERSNGSTEGTQTDEMMTPSVSIASTNGSISPEVEKMSMNGLKEGLNEDFDHSLDQKKTVASSSKNMQLPPLNNKG